MITLVNHKCYFCVEKNSLLEKILIFVIIYLYKNGTKIRISLLFIVYSIKLINYFCYFITLLRTLCALVKTSISLLLT